MKTVQKFGLNHEAIRWRRTKNRLTMGECATKATEYLSDTNRKGVFTKQRWCDIEMGRASDVRVSTLQAVAWALGCDIEDIVFRF